MGESRLARLATRGDARAFEVIFERHHQELYRYCRAILTDPDDAQDALQATMTAAMRALPGERRQIALRPWLYRVAHNESISIARSRREAPTTHEPATTAPGADLDAEDRERMRLLVSDLSTLPERQRAALVMRELSGLSYEEIGSALSTSGSAARQVVYEAREAMRETLAARDTDCAEIRELMSQRDGRILRGRRVRSHLRACPDCRDYLAAISRRNADLRMLAPPLPAMAATGLLAAILGESGKAGVAGSLGSGGGAAAGGGMLAGAGGASIAGKGGALVAAAVIGAGAAGVTTGAVDLPGGSSSPATPPAAPAEDAPSAGEGAGFANRPGEAHQGMGGAQGQGSGQSHANGNRGNQGAGNGQGTRNGHANQAQHGTGSHGQAAPAGGSDGVTGPPAHANGNGPPATAGTGTGNSGGNSSSSSGVSAAPPRSETGALHSNAGTGAPPEQANGQGNPDDG